MVNNNERDFFLDFDIENARIMITNSGGFFLNRYTHNDNGKVHSHNFYEFHIVLEDKALLETSVGNYPLNECQACVLPPLLIHKAITPAPACVRMSFCFSFEDNKKKSEFDAYAHISKVFGELGAVTMIEDATKLADVLKATLPEFYTQDSYQDYKLRGYFTVFITELISAVERERGLVQNRTKSAKYKDNDLHTLTRSIIEEYTAIHFNLNPSLSELAELIHFSTKQTARLFEKSFGTTFKQHIIQLRINSAKYLLTNTDLSVEEISAKVGYSSYNGFYRVFSSETGVAPLEYRKRERNKIR